MTAASYLKARGVTRLCHFTKIKDLTHIISFNLGIQPTKNIVADIVDKKDPMRLDGQTDHVCCSIEYPNCWYLRQVQRRDTDRIFRDWVVIFLDLSVLDSHASKSSPRNSATGNGAFISSNIDDLPKLFSQTIAGRPRPRQMLSCCPTDDQAEILIEGAIPLSYISGFAVYDEETAGTVSSILRTFEYPELPIYVAPDLLSTQWSSLVRCGIRPQETKFTIEGGSN